MDAFARLVSLVDNGNGDGVRARLAQWDNVTHANDRVQTSSQLSGTPSMFMNVLASTVSVTSSSSDHDDALEIASSQSSSSPVNGSLLDQSRQPFSLHHFTFAGDNAALAVPLGIGLATLSLLTFLGNAMVVHAIRTEKKLHTVSGVECRMMPISKHHPKTNGHRALKLLISHRNL